MIVRGENFPPVFTAGQAVYVLTTGKCGVADANAAGKQQFRGIALNGAAAGQSAVRVRIGSGGRTWRSTG